MRFKQIQKNHKTQSDLTQLFKQTIITSSTGVYFINIFRKHFFFLNDKHAQKVMQKIQ